MTNRLVPAGYEDDLSDEDLMNSKPLARSVRVLPGMHIGAGLNGADFDISLSADLNNWLTQFVPTAYKRTPQSMQALKEKLLSDEKPAMLMLKLVANTPGCNNLRNRNVANFILEVFCDLSQRQPELTHNLDDNTRMVAFNFVKNCGNKQIIRTIIETFKMEKINEPVYEKIVDLLQQKKYLDAAYSIVYTKQTARFNHLEVLFPLVLQDRLQNVYEYLDVASQTERETFVSFLDSLLDKRRSVVEHCDDILHQYRYADVKCNMLKPKPISKMVLKLAERYQLPPPEHMTFNRACAFITFQYHNYMHGEKSLDAYRELVRDMANTPKVQHYFVQKLSSLNALEEAVYWAREFKLELADCPRDVQIMFERGYAQQSSSSSSEHAANNVIDIVEQFAENVNLKTRNANEYLALTLPKEAVILIDTRDKFLNMLVHLKKQKLIGFDSEWKPTYDKSELVSLVQLGCWERVYLVDCMSSQLTPDLWCTLGCDIFNNVDLLKIGFSLDQDLRMLTKSLPLSLNLTATRGYLDLRALYRHLKYMQILNYPYGNGCDTGESLSALSELCLGKKLDKLDQCSNWANRPLRAEQIAYAALDAHCLLQIYQVLIDHLKQLGYNPHEIVEEVIVTKNSQLVNKNKKGNTDAKVLNADGSLALMSTQRKKLGDKTVPASVSQYKFLCQAGLKVFSQELRKLGIDSVTTQEFELNHICQRAADENRYLLCTPEHFRACSDAMPKGRCLVIPADATIEQVLHFVALFNIQIEEADIGSRCSFCNTKEFIFVLREQIKDYWLSKFNKPNKGKIYKSGKQLPNLNAKITHITGPMLLNKRTSCGKLIQIDSISEQELLSAQHLLVCNQCGEIASEEFFRVHSAVRALIK